MVGTGNTGAASAFATLGLVYFVVMVVASFSYRVPAEDWKPAGWTPPSGDRSFAAIPAYLADIFGTKFVGGIHGRLLTAWSTAGVCGPLVITSLREHSVGKAVHGLALKVDPEVFRQTFGASIGKLDELVAKKSVTVSKLMEIAPEGTVDPTSSLYNSTMYAMAALLVIAFFANLAVHPVGEEHYLEEPKG